MTSRTASSFDSLTRLSADEGGPASEAAAMPQGLAPAIDPERFARGGESLAGCTAVSQMPRLLASGLLEETALVHWRLEGELARDALDRIRPFLTLSLRFAPVLACGRCLGPLALDPLVVRRRFRLAASERQAGLEDPEAGSDVDVMAAVPRLELADLIEDEAMLALPMAAFHEVCPRPETLN
ncbi:MAG: DUF177 domain-containing protein [Lautropia sp.]|nr:DUF177 domain-containing protein [Lautropia sp.]